MTEATPQSHIFYSVWDVTAPELPPRSRLSHLAPIGAGTAEVESLTGYIARLAAIHCVNPGALFAQEMVPLINCSYLLKSETEPVGHALHLVKKIQTVNGGGAAISRWVGALESLTCQDNLHLLTMLPWGRFLAPRYLMRVVRTWCPDCFAEDREKGESAYERLIWTLLPVSICLHHRKPLEETCPHCGHTSPVLTVRSRPGHCFFCDRWLGAQRTKVREMEQPWEESIQRLEKAQLVGEMLTLSPKLPPSLSPRDFADHLNRHIRQITVGNAAGFARFIEIDYLVLRALRYGVNRPVLDVFITLLLGLQLSVKDFLDGKQSGIEPPDRREFILPRSLPRVKELMQAALIDPVCPSVSELSSRIGYQDQGNFRQADPEMCKRISARNRKVRTYDPLAHRQLYDDQTLREKLSAACQENPAPSLQQIAKRLGYKYPSTLHARCPDLYNALIERRRTYLKERNESVKRQLTSVLTEEPPPSLRKIAARLGHKSESRVSYQFPELAKAIADRYRGYWKNGRDQAKLALEAALTECPPPSVRQIARDTARSLSSLYRHYPELCRQVAANRIQYLHTRSVTSKERRKAEIKREALNLAEQYPKCGKG